MTRPLAGLFYLTVALGWCVTTANAYVVAVTTSDWPNYPSDVFEVDIVIDTGGAAIYGYIIQVYFEPAELSVVSGTLHPLPGSDSSSLYLYPDSWYITDTVFAGVPVPGVDMSIATLVFHVMDLPSTTRVDIVPVVEVLLGTGVADFSDSTAVSSYTFHVVPEPVTPLLLASGVGLLVLLGRLGQRDRAP